MKIVFLGYAVSECDAETLSGVSVAGNKMQLNILRNMKNANTELKVVTVLPIAPFPGDRCLFFKKKSLQLGDGVEAAAVAFINIPLFKQLCQILSLYREAAAYVSQHSDAVIFTFNMFPQVGVPARWLKRKYGCRIVALLADLPIDDNPARTGIQKILRKRFEKSTEKSMRCADQVVVLNRLAQEIYAPQAECLVIDGGVNLEEYPETLLDRPAGKRKNIVYCGSLAEYSGVRQLVQALENVENQEVELDIYGDGSLKGFILEKAGERIHYCGKVSNEKMLTIQREAWLLVNPRPVDDAIAQVTFPSKIFEYLMSGTPVLTTRLNGFSKEYEGKLFFAEDNKPETLAYWIEWIAKMDVMQLRNMAAEAEKFVREEKNWKKQTDKIMAFIDRLQNK